MKSQRGFTVIEVLVSMTIGLFAIGGALTSMQHAWRSYQASAATHRMQERALYALGVLEPDIQLAGYWGWANGEAFAASDLAVPATIACGADNIPVLGAALEFSATSDSQDCGNDVLPGTSALTIRRVATTAAVREIGRIHLTTLLHPVVTHSLGLEASPPTGLGPPPESRSEIRNYILRRYYISRHSDGDRTTPALRVLSLGSIRGRAAFIDTEVMPGVESLQVQIHNNTLGRLGRADLQLGLRSDTATPRGGRSLVRRSFALRNAA
jgi:type IV pilus assembly protein PilW